MYNVKKYNKIVFDSFRMRQQGTRNSDKLYSGKIFLFDGAGGPFII